MSSKSTSGSRPQTGQAHDAEDVLEADRPGGVEGMPTTDVEDPMVEVGFRDGVGKARIVGKVHDGLGDAPEDPQARDFDVGDGDGEIHGVTETEHADEDADVVEAWVESCVCNDVSEGHGIGEAHDCEVVGDVRVVCEALELGGGDGVDGVPDVRESEHAGVHEDGRE